MKYHTLIASDVDGTLIPEETTVLPAAVLTQIRAAHERGFLFMAASGRQYPSLRALFEPVADKMAFLIENGGGIYYHDQLRYTNGLPRETALAIARYVMDVPGCEFLTDDAYGSTILPKSDAFETRVRDEMKLSYRRLHDLSELPAQPLKIAVFCPEGTERYADTFQRDWGKRVKVVVSGRQWIDFNLSDKGTGLLAACREFDIPQSQTIAFGDNWNDVSMLENAACPYIMSTANVTLKARFSRHCDDVAGELKKICEKFQEN